MNIFSSRFSRLSSLGQRLSSSLTYTSKPLPPKAHHHQPISDDVFPHGYAATGLHCGIKKTGALDLGYILSTSPHPTAAAACFTRNAFQAAPVLVSRDVLAGRAGRARAVVVNSGCANAVTGAAGLANAWAMTRAADALLADAPAADAPSEALVLSTGVIGQQLPIERILGALERERTAPSAAAGFAAWERVARAFMTTDTFPKLRAREFAVGGRTYRLAGVDKGAGMIHPDMAPAALPAAPHATLLGCIVTDAPVAPQSLQRALAHAVDRSFNAISVDGEMSTNDTVLLLANGAAHGADETPVEIDEDADPEAYVAFRDALTDFAAELAQLVVRDGEGATKFVTVTVKVGAMVSPSFLSKGMAYPFWIRARPRMPTRTKSHPASRLPRWSRPLCMARTPSQGIYLPFAPRR
jgi:glutamate N-acetyltransferase/amino-acid N-acetyltransferase